MFGKKKAQHPTVELFEVSGDGASFAWNDAQSRELTFEIFVELVRRLERIDVVRRLRRSGLIAPRIDVAAISSFVQAAPQLLNQPHQAYEFEFRLNDGEHRYFVGHLDQGVSGIRFRTPADALEVFWSELQATIAEYREVKGGVTISTGPYL